LKLDKSLGGNSKETSGEGGNAPVLDFPFPIRLADQAAVCFASLVFRIPE